MLALVRIKDELEKLIEREVDVTTKQSIEQSRNERRRREILRTAQVLHVA